MYHIKTTIKIAKFLFVLISLYLVHSQILLLLFFSVLKLAVYMEVSDLRVCVSSLCISSDRRKKAFISFITLRVQ